MNLHHGFRHSTATFRSGLIRAGAIIGFCLLLACASWIFDRTSLQIQLFSYGWSYGFWASTLPIVAVFILLLVLFNRAVLAGLLTLALVFALYAVNYLKIKYLAVPVSFGDVYLLDNLHLATLRLLADYIQPGYLILALLLAVAIVGVLAWRERLLANPRPEGRPSCGLLLHPKVRRIPAAGCMTARPLPYATAKANCWASGPWKRRRRRARTQVQEPHECGPAHACITVGLHRARLAC